MRDALVEQVRALHWAHCIDLGDGVVTPGLTPPRPELDAVLPDFDGRSVLDVGAFDGYYSFLAERRGAERVVALDHYAWGVDIGERNLYWIRCAEEGILPDMSRDETDFWHEDLPGRRPFDLAREALRSKVQAVVADFMTVDLAALGTFDIVLYLGVLYHMREPLTALQRLRAVTNDMAVIETEGLYMPDHPEDPLLRFYPGGELNGDFGNWFVPSSTALVGMCTVAGFRDVEIRLGPPPLEPPPQQSRLRKVVAAARGRLWEPPPPALQRYRLTVLARA
jgi:tRNA (mo5U34)-methyltransferase